MSLGRVPLFLTAFAAILLLSSSPGAAQNQLAYEGPGVDQLYPEQHMLFLKGVEDDQYLDRNWTTVTGLPSGRLVSVSAAYLRRGRLTRTSKGRGQTRTCA